MTITIITNLKEVVFDYNLPSNNLLHNNLCKYKNFETVMSHEKKGYLKNRDYYLDCSKNFHETDFHTTNIYRNQ